MFAARFCLAEPDASILYAPGNELMFIAVPLRQTFAARFCHAEPDVWRTAASSPRRGVPLGGRPDVPSGGGRILVVLAKNARVS